MKENKYNDNIVKIKNSKSNNSSKDWEERMEDWIENHQLLTWMIGGILILLWGIIALTSFICCFVYGVQVVIALCGSSAPIPVFKFILSIIVLGGCLGIAGWINER